jgi:hypothetical protein
MPFEITSSAVLSIDTIDLMEGRVALPDFLVIGAPKAGSTAVHEALVQHPQLFLSTPKEPKHFLTDGTRPRRSSHRGPGDAHSAREWVWQRERYERLFDAAPPGTLRGESTPFYLWDKAAHVRIQRAVPDVKLIAIIRDPVDRAYSNWTHLWCDGLEYEEDFVTACREEPTRIAAGYAPFWRYLELGKYGEQFEHLFRVFAREQVHVLRYKDFVDEPAKSIDSICEFLGVEPGLVSTIPHSNPSGWADGGTLNTMLRGVVREPRSSRRCGVTRRIGRTCRSSSGASSSATSGTTSACSRSYCTSRITTGSATRAAARTRSAGREHRRRVTPPSTAGNRLRPRPG